MARKATRKKVGRREKQQTPWLVFIGVAILAVLVVVALVQIGRPNVPQPDLTELAQLLDGIASGVTDGGLAYLGDPNAPIQIIEFEDFGCENCKTFYDSIEHTLVDAYIKTGEAVLFSYPVAFVNSQSLPGAEAAECALQQGKFWEFRHLLFLNQGVIPFTRTNLVSFAQAAGLDTTQFSSCYDLSNTRTIVQNRTRDAQTRGVTGTPTFDISGVLYQGVRPFDSTDPLVPGFKQIIESLQSGGS